ncbi:MAG: T9SS type A sorting domain-containing protein [Chitinophagales bacterium]|nr:T9SS type A sorting domain-containing protein [Chitinophagales bacterium]
MKNTLTIWVLLLALCGNHINISAQGWIRPGGGDKTILLSDQHFLSVGHGGFIKYDTEANRLWATSLRDVSVFETDSTSSHLFDVIELIDGSLMCTGTKYVKERIAPDEYGNIYRSELYWAKFDEEGGLIWEFTKQLGAFSGRDYANSVAVLPDGGFLIYGTYDEFSSELSAQMFIMKIDDEGVEGWTKDFDYPQSISEHGKEIMALPNGNFKLVGAVHFESMPRQLLLAEITAAGDLVSDNLIAEIHSVNYLGAPSFVRSSDDGYFIATHTVEPAFSIYKDMLIIKTDEAGTVQWADTIAGGLYDNVLDVAASPDGQLLMIGELDDSELGGRDLLFRKYALDGSIIWSRLHGGSGDDGGKYITNHPDGGYLLTGYIGEPDLLTGIPQNFRLPRLFKTNAQGLIYTNRIEGNVFDDFDLDCDYNGEEGMNDWILRVETSTGTQYLVTDEQGYYGLQMGEDTFQLSINNKPLYWDGCADPAFGFLTEDDTLTIDLPQQANVVCPYLEVDISTPFLRRCFENTYTVSYCNRGTAPAYDAYVEIEMDNYLSYVSSSLPLAPGSTDETLRFELGTIEVNACNTFNITVLVDCDSTLLGQTHCVEAHIYPDSLCLPTPNWSGASVEVDAACLGDSVLFIIQNVGPESTFGDLDYLVIEDEVILLEGNFGLDPSEQLLIKVPANGSTYRLETDQEPFHPGHDQPTVTVEGCTNNNGNNISLGYVSQYYENDSDPFVSIDCQENIGSFDPNDKKAYPAGYGPDHLIDPGQEIEYHIRFQNTGTDTAFMVVIRDPLSEWLDIESVRPGASSHPYEFTIVDGRVLEFRFDNIMLPDSTTNEPLSHGFIKFKVQQLPTTYNGLTIENTAAIFFDFNEAVITNTYFHNLGSFYIPSAPAPPVEMLASISTYPNPFSQYTIIELENYQGVFPVNMKIYDTNGRKVREEQITGDKYQLKREKLVDGIYFFRVNAEGLAIKEGKIIIQ